MTYKDSSDYNNILEQLRKYSYAQDILQTELNILIKEYIYNNNYNPVEHTKFRIKSEESVINKLQKKCYEINAYNIANHVHDMIGARIVCSFLSDVYNIVKLIKTSKQFKIKEEKDYIAQPKDTGYISYHLIVLVPLHLEKDIEYIEAEIQIRTIAMDFWASLDHKISYKFPTDVPKGIKEEMFKSSVSIKELDEKMEHINKKVNEYK